MSSDEDDKAKELADAIRALGDVFVGRIPTTLSSMESELDAIIRNGNDAAAWKNLHRHLHTLAGSAGTFGLAELGDRARSLEHRINDMLKAEDGSGDPARSEFMHDQRDFMVWVNAQFVKK
jgi:HPt (histidine-containing phosphotransfer) domain-containing protein